MLRLSQSLFSLRFLLFAAPTCLWPPFFSQRIFKQEFRWQKIHKKYSLIHEWKIYSLLLIWCWKWERFWGTYCSAGKKSSDSQASTSLQSNRTKEKTQSHNDSEKKTTSNLIDYTETKDTKAEKSSKKRKVPTKIINNFCSMNPRWK